MKTTMERECADPAQNYVLKFKSRNPEALQRFACAVPGEQTEWFFSEDARNLYAATMAARKGLTVKEGR